MAAFTIGAVSMVGIPPTAGFFSKWYLVLGAIEAQQWLFAALFLLSSLAVAVVFFRIIQSVYFKDSSDQGVKGSSQDKHLNPRILEPSNPILDEAPVSMLIPIFIMTAGILISGLFSGKIISTVIQFTVPKGF